MSRELYLPLGTTGVTTLYAPIRDAQGRYWTGTAFEAFNGAHVATYAVALAEEGTTGNYVADFPTAITTPGVYTLGPPRLKVGGSPAWPADTIVGSSQSLAWDGTETAVPSAGGGDPMATVVPGAYGVGTAGYAIGNPGARVPVARNQDAVTAPTVDDCLIGGWVESFGKEPTFNSTTWVKQLPNNSAAIRTFVLSTDGSGNVTARN